MTSQPLHNRFSSHMREISSRRPANWVQTRLYRHYHQKHHTPSDVKVHPVECVEDRGSLKKRESAWIKALNMIEPYGLNITHSPLPRHTPLPFPALLTYCTPSKSSFSGLHPLRPPKNCIVVPLGFLFDVPLRPLEYSLQSMLFPW